MISQQSSTNYEQEDITQRGNCQKNTPKNSHVDIWFKDKSYSFKKSTIISDE